MEVFDQIAQQAQDALEAAPLLLQRVIIGLLVFAVGYLVTRLIQHLVVRAVRRTPGGVTVEHALSRVIAIIGITLAFLTALSTMGVDIGALIAALGLTSLAIGLALDRECHHRRAAADSTTVQSRRCHQGQRCDGHGLRCGHPHHQRQNP